MAKIFLILIVASIVESIGMTYLAGGLKELQGPKAMTVSEITRVILSGAANGKIIGGIALEAAFFGALLYMLKVQDLSFIWPLTSIGFIVTTLAAHFILGEKVSASRWMGVLLIAVGAFLISHSEHEKGQPDGSEAPLTSTPLRPQ